MSTLIRDRLTEFYPDGCVEDVLLLRSSDADQFKPPTGVAAGCVAARVASTGQTFLRNVDGEWVAVAIGAAASGSAA